MEAIIYLIIVVAFVAFAVFLLKRAKKTNDDAIRINSRAVEINEKLLELQERENQTLDRILFILEKRAE